jgi:hypothetical protein
MAARSNFPVKSDLASTDPHKQNERGILQDLVPTVLAIQQTKGGSDEGEVITKKELMGCWVRGVVFYWWGLWLLGLEY